MASRLIIGLMSGTSVDAIDAALVRVDGRGGKYHAEVLHHHERPWPAKVRRRLLGVMAPAPTTTQEICELNAVVAAQFAAAAEEILRVCGVVKSEIAALGSHGQTVCHLPPPAPPRHLRTQQRVERWKKAHTRVMSSTLQLGDVSMLATLTGITAVGNFRPADMAVGGQGAPLVPWTDDMLLADANKARCVQNIGGIANVTHLPRKSMKDEMRHARRQVLAFDTGPGNMVMDAVVAILTRGAKRFDRGGKMAANGELDLRLFRELQAHSYFSRRPPKSTGREEFGEIFSRRLVAENRKMKTVNLLHTLARLTAWSIADAYLQFLPGMPDEVIVCGGGADNPVLMGMVAEELRAVTSEFVGPKEIAVRRIDEFGIPNKAKEAASFALLAAATLDGVPANLPGVTGAGRRVVLGVIARPAE